MTIDLKGVKVADHFNGIGMHDTAGSEVATFGGQEARNHARELREHGITLYKLFGGTTKVERAREYVKAGITVAVRFHVPKPWGRPPGQWVTPKDQVKQFVDAGAQMFELGWNEFNISDEWPDNKIPGDPKKIAQAVVDAWEVGLGGAGTVNGATLLFPSNTPGGSVDHRLCYPAIVAELTRRELLSTVQHVAMHPRPHNNAPHLVWTDKNTVTFDEWRWIRDQFPLGVYLWATEHGYSLHDDQNHDYPQIDLGMWTEYNWNLFVRMNPRHAQAIEPQLAGVFYWVERGWGHWCAWGKDALVDSPVPEMPAPSPLWIRMHDRRAELAFPRYGATPPLPPTYKQVDLVGKLAVHPTNKYKTRPASWIRQSILHYSWVTPPAADEAHETAQIQSIARRHVRLNWPGIAYHWIVGPSGTVHRVNKPETISYHAGKYNTDSVGVCCLLRQGQPTAVQVASTAALVLDLGYPMKLHKELIKTACPGVYLGPAVWQAMLDTPEPPVEPPATGFRVEYVPAEGAGLPLVIGNYPKPGQVLKLVAPWAWEVTAVAGSKAEFGPGGFEMYAGDDHSTFALSAEGQSWPVQMVPGKSSRCVWQ
jgi:hypothetical protein